MSAFGSIYNLVICLCEFHGVLICVSTETNHYHWQFKQLQTHNHDTLPYLAEASANSSSVCKYKTKQHMATITFLLAFAISHFQKVSADFSRTVSLGIEHKLMIASISADN